MISPQGYKLGEAPEAKNPFWGEGEDSNVNKIYATASVDEGTGVPSVTTSKTVSGSDITFDFAFHNLKGERGPQGPAGATGATGPAGPAGADGAPGATGATGPQGPEGPKGDTGATGPAGPAGPQGPDGPEGPAGKPGPIGPKGDPGPKGADGFSPTARIEYTGDNQVTIYVTDANGTTSAVLNGEAGPQGPIGPEGPQGPVGPKGDTGEQGTQGPEGPAGPGVPAGGTAGQVLTKKSGTDYDTEWKDAGGGSTSDVVIHKAKLKLTNVTLTPASSPYSYYFDLNSDILGELYNILLAYASVGEGSVVTPDLRVISVIISMAYNNNSASGSSSEVPYTNALTVVPVWRKVGMFGYAVDFRVYINEKYSLFSKNSDTSISEVLITVYYTD